jgi:hypothetical protein
MYTFDPPHVSLTIETQVPVNYWLLSPMGHTITVHVGRVRQTTVLFPERKRGSFGGPHTSRDAQFELQMACPTNPNTGPHVASREMLHQCGDLYCVEREKFTPIPAA